jgi:hypothetical protein
MMIGQNTGPKTQSIDAVKSLLTWRGRGTDPMPSILEFVNEGEGNRLVLVLSNKKDSYYVVTPAKCSCPSATYHPGQPCKHQRKHFGAKLASRPTEAASIRPTAGWIGPDGQRANGPVEA